MSGRFPGSDVSDAMRALQARQATDPVYERMDHKRHVAQGRAESQARKDERNTYRGGEARKRRPRRGRT